MKAADEATHYLKDKVGLKEADRIVAAVRAEALRENTEAFFQAGHTYSGKHGWKFRVDTITTHPEDGARTALGWRFFNGQWEPYAYEEDDWAVHQAAGHTDDTETQPRS